MSIKNIVNAVYRRYMPIIKFKWNQFSVKPGFWITLICALSIPFNPSFIIYGMILYGFMILNRRTNIKETKIKLEAYDPNIPVALDAVIDEAFNEYILFNKGYQKGKVYIKATEEREIINTMVNSVSARISDTMMDKLNAYYNDEMVPEIISAKIFMAVTAYVAENNRTDSTPTKKEVDNTIMKMV